MILNLKHLCKDTSRHGQIRYYVRRPSQPKIRMLSDPGSPEFMAEYLAAVNGSPTPLAAPSNRKDTFKGLCLSYMASGDFKRLAAASQSNQRLIFESCWDEPLKAGSPLLFGDCPLSEFGPKHIRILRDRKANLPGAANNRIKYLRRLFSWAETDHPKLGNPAKSVDRFKTKSSGFRHWTLAEVRQYEAAHSVGTQARLALDLMLYTGVRRSDAVRLGREHVDQDGWLVFKQSKTGGVVEIPIIQRLAETLAAGPIGAKFFLETTTGAAFTAAGFGNKFRGWCDQAKLSQCTAHGLRKVMSARLAELGVSDRGIMAITGHKGEREVSTYTKGAQRRILAAAAMEKLQASLSHRLSHLEKSQ